MICPSNESNMAATQTSVSHEEFFAIQEQFQAQKRLAEKTKIPVICAYKLIPYERRGSQGTSFELIGSMFLTNYHEAFETQLDRINRDLAMLDKRQANGIYLLVERLYSATEHYYYPDGSNADDDEPTEGYLRVRIKDCPANNVWVYVTDVEGGIECTPASATSKLTKPEGWDGCHNKLDIEVKWAGVEGVGSKVKA